MVYCSFVVVDPVVASAILAVTAFAGAVAVMLGRDHTPAVGMEVAWLELSRDPEVLYQLIR